MDIPECRHSTERIVSPELSRESTGKEGGLGRGN